MAMKATTEKSTALTKGMAVINKMYKAKDPTEWGAVDSANMRQSLPHLPSGSLVLDYLIGGQPNNFGISPCPGFPRGRIVQIWGHESAGKTTVCLTLAATTCAAGGTVLYIDFENAIVPDYAATLGVPIDDTSQFLLVQPETLEDGFNIMSVMAKSGVDLIIVDSVGVGIPKSSLKKDFDEDEKPGLLAKQWGRFLPRFAPMIAKSGTALVGISQVRASFSFSGPAGPSKTIQGGNAWKFFASARIELAKVKTEKSKIHNALSHKMEDQTYGSITRAKMVKSKVSSSQGRQANFYIRFGEGIDDVSSLIDIASAHNVIKKSGSWFSWSPKNAEDIKVQGTEGLRSTIVSDPKLVDELYNEVIPYLTQEIPDAPPDDEEAIEDPEIAEMMAEFDDDDDPNDDDDSE